MPVVEYDIQILSCIFNLVGDSWLIGSHHLLFDMNLFDLALETWNLYDDNNTLVLLRILSSARVLL